MLAFQVETRETLGSFIPWRLSGLLSGYLPTDTRPQARAKLGKNANSGFESASQEFFCDARIFLARARESVAESEQALSLFNETLAF
jgi:hypothetical protein